MIDFREVGKTPLPTKKQLEKEGVDCYIDGVDSSNPTYTDGLRTRDQKEYDRIRHRKNWLKTHPNAGDKYNQNRDHIDQTGKNNTNYRHGRYVVDKCIKG